ncbi:MAG: hypothetical protein PW735_06130 [Acidobacteriaceae bacterium]|nr:hypothetical protein [Acidobacteriaceae bacterium]
MDDKTDYWTLGSGSFGINLQANSDDLLSDANEWFECAKALTDLLMESMQDGQFPDRRRAIFAGTDGGQERWCTWDRSAQCTRERMGRCDL